MTRTGRGHVPTKDRRYASRDAQERFHWEWLGMAQPIEGLVFSVPVLAEAQITPEYRPSTTCEFVDRRVG